MYMGNGICEAIANFSMDMQIINLNFLERKDEILAKQARTVGGFRAVCIEECKAQLGLWDDKQRLFSVFRGVHDNFSGLMRMKSSEEIQEARKKAVSEVKEVVTRELDNLDPLSMFKGGLLVEMLHSLQDSPLHLSGDEIAKISQRAIDTAEPAEEMKVTYCVPPAPESIEGRIAGQRAAVLYR